MVCRRETGSLLITVVDADRWRPKRTAEKGDELEPITNVGNGSRDFDWYSPGDVVIGTSLELGLSFPEGMRIADVLPESGTTGEPSPIESCLIPGRNAWRKRWPRPFTRPRRRAEFSSGSGSSASGGSTVVFHRIRSHLEHDVGFRVDYL